MNQSGLFVGLATLDLIYLTAKFPDQNEKIVALDQTVAAGGPATNAAVTFCYLGNQATLLGSLGQHPLSNLIRTDLANYSVRIIDLEPQRSESPPVSSIIVTQGSGDRAVISLNTSKSQAPTDRIPPDILPEIDIVLIDGHQMAVSHKIAKQAKANQIPVVIDGGSWKVGWETVLPFVDYAVCSANFYPPNCRDRQDVFSYLIAAGIPHIAITQGEKPIQSWTQGEWRELDVPAIEPVDTLGAGDIFHGAFCHYILQYSFQQALTAAAQVASRSCQYFGTRHF
jgi:sugar/nucleoside kinase (ribokinase family)